MSLMRTRISSFLVGFGLATGLGMYQIRQDLLNSHAEIKASVSAPGLHARLWDQERAVEGEDRGIACKTDHRSCPCGAG